METVTETAEEIIFHAHRCITLLTPCCVCIVTWLCSLKFINSSIKNFFLSGSLHQCPCQLWAMNGATQKHVRSVRDLYSECLYRTVVKQLASPLRVSAEVVLRNIAAARAGGPPAPVAIIGQLSVCSLHQIRRMVPVPHYLPSPMGSVGNRSDTIMKRANVQLSRRVEFKHIASHSGMNR